MPVNCNAEGLLHHAGPTHSDGAFASCFVYQCEFAGNETFESLVNETRHLACSLDAQAHQNGSAVHADQKYIENNEQPYIIFVPER